jgi:hypothetical protein
LSRAPKKCLDLDEGEREREIRVDEMRDYKVCGAWSLELPAMRDFRGKRWCEPMDDPDTTDASNLTPLCVFHDARLLY